MVDVYVSAQQTAAVASHVWSTLATVKASNPPFNRKARSAEWPDDGVVYLDVPTFWPSVHAALAPLLVKYLAGNTIFDQVGLPKPALRLDTFHLTRTKASKWAPVPFGVVQPLVDALSPAVADRVAAFLRDSHAFDYAAATSEQWDALVEGHVAPGWKDHLHFDVVLKLFGADDAENARVLAMPDIRHKCVRWVSATLGCARISPGSIADVVNLIFAMLERPAPSPTDTDAEGQVLAAIADFQTTELRHMWYPDMHVHDAEADDLAANAIINGRLVEAGLKPCITVIQVPPEFPVERLPSGVVFVDDQSTNVEALRRLWGF